MTETRVQEDSGGGYKVGRRQKTKSHSIKEGTDGVVLYHVKRSSAKRGSRAEISASDLIRKVRAGLPMRELDELRVTLNVPMETLVPLLGISRATLHRRRAAGKLDSTESDRVVRFARLVGKAVETMESVENARLWLNAPQFGLGGAIPLEYAQTEIGAREVEDLLGRIEYGVYS